MGGVDQRGGAPGTRETDLLNPVNLVHQVNAVVLAGGSAFGLDAASGVVRYLDERGFGYQTTAGKVPIVPAAILFDLTVGTAFSSISFATILGAVASSNPNPPGSPGAGLTVGMKVAIEQLKEQVQNAE